MAMQLPLALQSVSTLRHDMQEIQWIKLVLCYMHAMSVCWQKTRYDRCLPPGSTLCTCLGK